MGLFFSFFNVSIRRAFFFFQYINLQVSFFFFNVSISRLFFLQYINTCESCLSTSESSLFLLLLFFQCINLGPFFFQCINVSIHRLFVCTLESIPSWSSILSHSDVVISCKAFTGCRHIVKTRICHTVKPLLNLCGLLQGLVEPWQELFEPLSKT